MKALSNLTSDTKPIKGPVPREISQWTEPGPWEAIACLAAGQSDYLAKGAKWLPFSFSAPWLIVGGDGRDFDQVMPMT